MCVNKNKNISVHLLFCHIHREVKQSGDFIKKYLLLMFYAFSLLALFIDIY